MASTSTNKQPLLVDRVFHYVVDLNTAFNNGIDVNAGGTNSAVLLVNATSTDGAIVEDVYSIARSTNSANINLYLSTASDFLRPNQATFIGRLASGTTIAEVTRWNEMPKILAPVAQVANGVETLGDDDEARPVQLRALYIPKGRTLWAARDSNANLTDGPLLGCQGGWY